MTRDCYRASIGSHKALESVFAPRASDPRLRDFCEAWQTFALEIEDDTRTWRRQVDPADWADLPAWSLTYMGIRYDLSDGEAAAACDAYALASIENGQKDRWRKVKATLEGIRKRRAREAARVRRLQSGLYS